MPNQNNIDITNVRERLNQLPFRDGARQVAIGRLSNKIDLSSFDTPDHQDEEDIDDSVEQQTAVAVGQCFDQLQRELAPHDLELVRDADDPDRLYVLQRLRKREVDLTWMGDAMAWVSRVLLVAAEMSLPTIAGMWLDAQLGTQFLGLVGIGIGVPLGLCHLLWLVRKKSTLDQVG